MPKTKEELEQLKQELSDISNRVLELSDDEIASVVGGGNSIPPEINGLIDEAILMCENNASKDEVKAYLTNEMKKIGYSDLLISSIIGLVLIVVLEMMAKKKPAH